VTGRLPIAELLNDKPALPAAPASQALQNSRNGAWVPKRPPESFFTSQAALKCLYLAIMSLDPTGRGRQRWSNRWKAALNAFDIT